MDKEQKDLLLLPASFRKIAFGIMILSVLYLLLREWQATDKSAIQTMATSGFLTSLLLLAITKSKIEDERMTKIRLKAFTGSFIYAVVIVITNPVVSFIFGDHYALDKRVTELLISMFFFYFIMIFILKKSQ